LWPDSTKHIHDFGFDEEVLIAVVGVERDRPQPSCLAEHCPV
jgi:hypothetical protein